MSGASDADAGPPAPVPGQQPPFAVITPTNQSGVIIMVTSLCLSFAMTSLLLRVYIRYEFRTKFGRDDAAAYLSMGFAVIQSALVFTAVSRGFGKTVQEISPLDMVAWQKHIYVADIFFVATMWLTKCSVAYLFIRLSPDTRHNRAAQGVLACATLLMIVSVFLVATGCDVKQPWIFVDPICNGLLSRWQAIASFDVLTEAMLFALAIFMVQGLQLPLAKKFVVVAAFAFRLPIIAPIILRIHYLAIQLASDDPSLQGVAAAVCTQAEICLGIVATTTPCLRPFMSALNTHYGGAGGGTTSREGTTFVGSSGSRKTPYPRGSRGKVSNEFSLSTLKSRGAASSLFRSKKTAAAAAADGSVAGTTLVSMHGGKGDVGEDVESGGTRAPPASVAASPLVDDKTGRPLSPVLRWDGVLYNVEVGKGCKFESIPEAGEERGHGSIGSGSSRRSQMIISKNTEWSVDFEQGQPGRAA